MDKNGLAIDIEGFAEGFARGLEIRVTVNPRVAGLHTLTVAETGERWRLLVKQIRGGTIVLGVSPPEDITGIDERLEKNATTFRASLEDALRVVPSDIDRNLDYAIVEDSGRLRFALGGIPLQIVAAPSLLSDGLREIRTSDGLTYGILSIPFHDPTGQIVGRISVFDELPLKPWRSRQAWIVNLISSAALAVIVTFLAAPLGRKFEPEILFEEALRVGESATVEFKESLRWDVWQARAEATAGSDDQKKKGAEAKNIAEGIAVKTVAALLNNRAGGSLFLGIADDKRIVGLERDYESLVKPGERGGTDKDRDRLQLHLRNLLLAAKIGRDISNLYVDVAILSRDDKDVCLIHARPAPAPVYLSDNKGKSLYVRVGASTVLLDVEEAVDYVNKRWPQAVWRRIWNRISMREVQ